MQKPESSARVHHPYSPSKLQLLEACPKYQGTDSVCEAALTGTMQHDVADSGIDDARLPDYKAMAAVECMKFCESRAKEYPGGTILKEEYLPVDDEEIWVDVEPAKGEPVSERKCFKGTTAGYSDWAIVSADGLKGEVVDYKYGQHAVEDADNNLQGIAYALGLLKRFPTLQSIRVWFIMPHRDELSEHTFTRDQFDGLYLRVRTVVGRAVEANKDARDFSTAKATTGTCLFCSHVGRCPKVAELVIKLGRKYDPLQVPESVTPSLILDPAQVAIGIKLAQVASTWAEAYRRQATARTVEDPTFVPKGYTLVSTSKRIIKSAKKLGELAKTFLPESDREKVETLYDLPITALEKLISTAAPRGEKDATVKKFGEDALKAEILELGQAHAFLRQSKNQTERTNHES
jgi:hypothetical protein